MIIFQLRIFIDVLIYHYKIRILESEWFIWNLFIRMLEYPFQILLASSQ